MVRHIEKEGKLIEEIRRVIGIEIPRSEEIMIHIDNNKNINP